MEHSKEKFQADLKLLGKATETLVQALEETFTDIVRDAVIQRFEYVFELSWKTIQAAVEYMGSSCNSPRDAIKEAFKMEWVTNPEGWLEAMEARNKTSHTYSEKLAQTVYNVAKEFPVLVQELMRSLKKI